jgi:hypothetical protein
LLKEKIQAIKSSLYSFNFISKKLERKEKEKRKKKESYMHGNKLTDKFVLILVRKYGKKSFKKMAH